MLRREIGSFCEAHRLQQGGVFVLAAEHSVFTCSFFGRGYELCCAYTDARCYYVNPQWVETG